MDVHNTELGAVRNRLSADMTVADLQWSLFVAAMASYKRDTVVRPFPPEFLMDSSQNNNGHITSRGEPDDRDFNKLEKVIDQTESFRQLLRDDLRGLSETQVSLLHWCLHRPFSLKFCQQTVMAEIQKKAKQAVPSPSPNYIFEVLHSKENDRIFQDRQGTSGLLYGYHGSSIENFHSILNFGLQGHRSKNALFGEGTYLSSELGLSLQYAPQGRGWTHSSLGLTLSCVAVCEMIDHPSVKCHTSGTQLAKSSSRSKIAGSEGGEIPETYYVVRNNDMIRVKYLLVYANRTSKRKQTFMERHRFFLVVCFYVLLLIAISLYNSQGLWIRLRRLLK